MLDWNRAMVAGTYGYTAVALVQHVGLGMISFKEAMFSSVQLARVDLAPAKA